MGSDSKTYGLNSSHDPFVGVSGYLVGYSCVISGFEQDVRARQRMTSGMFIKRR
jgi:hypothetical protein